MQTLPRRAFRNQTSFTDSFLTRTNLVLNATRCDLQTSSSMTDSVYYLKKQMEVAVSNVLLVWWWMFNLSFFNIFSSKTGGHVFGKYISQSWSFESVGVRLLLFSTWSQQLNDWILHFYNFTFDLWGNFEAFEVSRLIDV